MGNTGSSSLTGAAIQVVAVAGGAVLALGAWSYASSLLSQNASADSDSIKGTVHLQMDMQQVESDDHSIPQDPTPDHPPLRGIIKIMCYNIWSLECIKIHERMNAISLLIQQHSPDIILLQEVTPLIYDIFQNCNWWGLYRCSVSPKKPTRFSFCMLLSMLPVKKFFFKHLENTTTGRGLYVAVIVTRDNKKLFVATCHFKRPNPRDMHSEERVSNAKEALGHLHHARNIVLGGDMNWDESSDGPFPFLHGWHDAWCKLRPEEDGWTYDTGSNRMLTHSRWLQKRLDRFICKLRDFEMIGIEMIGTKAIPGVWYKSGPGAKLPVLPSDHYGLILKICPKE